MPVVIDWKNMWTIVVFVLFVETEIILFYWKKFFFPLLR